MFFEDWSRPARLPSEAITLQAMEPVRRERRQASMLDALRREWPEAGSQHALSHAMEEVPAVRAPVANTAPGGVSMGQAALRSVLRDTRR